MAHLGARAFEEIGGEVVQVTCWIQSNERISNYIGLYERLVDYDTQGKKEDAFLIADEQYNAKQTNFEKIPGLPIAYWVSNTFCRNYNEKKIADYAEVITGMTIGNNKKIGRAHV